MMHRLSLPTLFGLALSFAACSDDADPANLQCPAELEDCDGTCVDIANNPSNCGGCGISCASDEVCGNGTCSTQCPSGQTECDRQCTNLQTSLTNCGSCGTECAEGEVCSQGSCQTSCGGGLVECGGICRDLDTDRFHCGACDAACASGEVCVEGSCEVSCPAGQTNCDGFCIDTDTDRANCGGCGLSCAAGEICTAGACEISCPDGQTACDGACVDTATDRNNCGGCGTICGAGEACDAGSCALSCGGNTPTLCDGGCVNTDTDPNHCGGCGVVCGAGQACDQGACVANCGPGLTDCDGSCVDLANNPSFCGACNNSCPAAANADPVCIQSACTLTCQAGFGDCNADIATDGCETDLSVDVNNCGGCGLVCELDNAVAGCVSAACTVVACDSGFGNCDGDDATGCENDVTGDDANCGACGTVCTSPEQCLASVCSLTGEDCASAIALGLGARSYGWSATSNDYLTTKPGCISQFVEIDGPDVVFSYTATVTGEARFTVDKAAEQRHVVVASNNVCGTPRPELVCSSEFFATSLGGRFDIAAGTDYFIYVADTDEGAGALPNPLDIELVQTPCEVLTSTASIQLSPADTSTAASVVPLFEATFAGAIRTDVGTVTLTGNLGTSLSFDLAAGPDEISFRDDDRILVIDAGPYLPNEVITISWSGIESGSGCGVIPAPSWTVTIPAPSCAPGQGGVVGTAQTVFPTLITTFFKYYVEADENPLGFVYVGTTSDLWQLPKAGGATVDVPVDPDELGFAMLIDGGDIFTVQNTQTGTTGYVYRISDDAGLTFTSTDAVGFPRAPSDDIRGITSDGSRVYLITHENGTSAGTEIWSFDPARVPTTATLEGSFSDELQCSGLTLDDTYFYTACQSSEVIIRIDRATFDVTVVNGQWDVSAQKNSLQADDLDGDGEADVLYFKSFGDESYYVCDPAGPVPAFSDIHVDVPGTNYGLGFDPLSNRLWQFDDGFQGDFIAID